MDFGEKEGYSEECHYGHCEHALSNLLTDLVRQEFGVVEEGFVVDCVVEDGTAEEVHEDTEEPVQ